MTAALLTFLALVLLAFGFHVGDSQAGRKPEIIRLSDEDLVITVPTNQVNQEK